MLFRKLSVNLFITLLTFATASTFAQDKPAGDKPAPASVDTISGKYEGVARSPNSGDMPLLGEIKNDNGKLSGTIETPQGTMLIVGGTYAEGRISIKFEANGNQGTATAQVKGDKIIGEWTLAGQAGTLELRRAGATAATPATATSTAGTSDSISGQWEAAADAQGRQYPFTLKLKLEGDKVTGDGVTAWGSATISGGNLAGDKLTVVLNTPKGAITLTGTVAGGKIIGQFDFASQFQGKWEANRK